MSYMFEDATAFNQDLCHFAVIFSHAPDMDVNDMFKDSGCGDTSEEPTSATGPWCAVTTC